MSNQPRVQFASISGPSLTLFRLLFQKSPPSHLAIQFLSWPPWVHDRGREIVLPQSMSWTTRGWPRLVPQEGAVSLRLSAGDDSNM